ncbi:MAG: site-2 protease family protein [Nitrospirae bacterium]|nr:site-2 protease family protein [Nitrospirota bacterium]MCL5420952.1 site-2 protease family protein [Nitrospirota bacterium]
MNSSLEHGSWKIGTVMGIPIRVHFSWLIIFGMITWSLSTFYFPKAAPQLPTLSFWVAGAIAAILLFVSVALHELAHSVIALRYRLPIVNITLYIFGGVSQMKAEPPDPGAELRIAVAGPLSSFVLSFLFLLLYFAVTGELARALFSYLAQLNLILGVFNLIPGFPMDGGRVVRAFIWKKSGDFFYATRKASGYGQKIALFFVFFGLFSLFAGLTGGLWLMLIGWFLHTAAQASYQQASLQQTLAGVKVRAIMTREIITMPSDMTVETAVNEYFLRYGYGGFPVMGKERFLGFVTLKEVKDVPRERWHEVKVSAILTPHDRRGEVSENDDALKALELMISEDQGRLAVMEQDKLTGLITRNGIAKYVQLMGR